MGHLLRLLVLALGATALACASADMSPSANSGPAFQGDTVYIRFAFDSIDPVSAHIGKDQDVQWVNLAEDSAGRVVFPASIASKFECADLAPMFERVEETYQSLRIEGTMSEPVTLPCPLAAGSYDYEIWVYSVGDEISGDEMLPSNKFRAVLVVE